jgi:hypothetical protein
MSRSCRRVPLLEDLKLRREEEKREQMSTGVINISKGGFMSSAYWAGGHLTYD